MIKLRSTYKQKIKSLKNGKLRFKGSFIDGLLFLKKEGALKDNDRIENVYIYPRYILFGEKMMEFTLKEKTVNVIDQKIVELRKLTDRFLFIDYYSHERCDMYKINNEYTKYRLDTRVLCPVSDGIEKALDLAIAEITKLKQEFEKNQ